MSLVFDWSNSTSLNPVDITGTIGIVEVEDLVEVLDSTLFTLISLRFNVVKVGRFDVAKDGQVFVIRPVRELVVIKNEVGIVGVVVIVDDPVPKNESLKSNGKLFNLLIYFVEFGNIIEELELI